MVGASHETAALPLLERLAIGGDDLPGVLGELSGGAAVEGVIVVSTCQRTEIYACLRQFHNGIEELVTFLAGRAGCGPGALVPHLSVQHGDEALTHLFLVAAGARSVTIGETEILGQLQRAVAAAQARGTSSPLLRRAFDHALRTGRRARAETGIGAGASSLPTLGVRLAGERLDTLGGRSALVIGAGEMGRAAATALRRAGVGDISVVGRTAARAREVAEAVDGRGVVAMDHLAGAVESVDVVLSATSATGYVLDRRLVEDVMARRPTRPLVVVDLAVPRDADPALSSVPGVTLFDLDDLRRAAGGVMAERRHHLPAVEGLVAGEVERFLRETSARDIGPLVSALRCHVEDVRRSEIQRWQARVGPLDPQAVALVEAVTAGVVAKLLHAPTVRLKAVAGTPEADRYREALAALFDVHH